MLKEMPRRDLLSSIDLAKEFRKMTRHVITDCESIAQTLFVLDMKGIKH